MRTILSIVITMVLIIPTIAHSQSPYRIHSISVHNPEKKSAVAPRNAWAIGAQVGYSLENGEFMDDFGASAKTLLEILGKDSKSYGLYVMGNLSRLTTVADNENYKAKLIELQKSSQGINVGLYPHYIFGNPNNNSIIIYGSISYKLNSLKNVQDSLFYFNQAMIAFGLEFSFLKGIRAELPVTVSFEPSVIFFEEEKYKNVFGENKSFFWGLNATLIIPVGKSKGFMVEYLTSKDIGSTFSVGLILTN